MTTRTTITCTCHNCGQTSTTVADTEIITKVEEGGIHCHRYGYSVARITYNTTEEEEQSL